MRKKRTSHLEQLSLQTLGWGGIRRGAGRPKLKSAKVGHKKRPEIKKLTPMHVTLRLQKGLPSLRTKKGFQVFRNALLGAKNHGLRALQFAVLGNHFHILIEVRNNSELAQAMRSLNGRLTRAINYWVGEKGCKRKGSAFTERYHLEVLRSPTQLKRAMVYIFSNAAKHFKRERILDPFCSYVVFTSSIHPGRGSILVSKDWSRPRISRSQINWFGEMLSPAESWLARVGWLRGD